MPVPEIDLEQYRLTVVDLNNNSKTLTLDEIKKLPKVRVNAAIQCAGNRRQEMSKVKVPTSILYLPTYLLYLN